MSYGIFDDFWDNQPNHLPLLHLTIYESDTDDVNLGKSLKLIDKIIGGNSIDDIYNDTRLMLNESNWRPHLLALIVILKLEKSESQKFIGFLWKRLCLGTWVSPQLLVTLAKIDFNFKEKSKIILNDNGLEKFSMNYLNEHELAENNFKYELSNNKILNSIRYLIYGEYLANIDDDNGAIYAENWNVKLTELRRLGLI